MRKLILRVVMEKDMLCKTAICICTLLSGLYISKPLMVMAQVISPETQKPYSIALENSELEARVNEPFFITLKLYPQKLPPGYSVSTLVDLLEYPTGTKPEIVTGFPKIRLKMAQAGSYTMAVRIALMTKSSCAGIDAEEIFAETVSVQVTER